jgi:hypothetical protein
VKICACVSIAEKRLGNDTTSLCALKRRYLKIPTGVEKEDQVLELK